MSARRIAFVKAALAHFGDVVLWNELDCSELVVVAGMAVGLPDRRRTFRAQTYADDNREDAKEPLPGDLHFWGKSWADVIHIAIAVDGIHILSADGATKAIRSREEAAQRPGARVRLHTGPGWYKSAPYLGCRRHAELDLPFIPLPKETP